MPVINPIIMPQLAEVNVVQLVPFAELAGLTAWYRQQAAGPVGGHRSLGCRPFTAIAVPAAVVYPVVNLTA